MGGMSGYGSDGSQIPHDYTVGGQEPIDYDFTYTSHSFLGATYNDGKADAFNKVKQGLRAQPLQEQAEGWGTVRTHVDDINTRLNKAYTATFDAWSGDDADTAKQTFGNALTSASNMKTYSDGMSQGMNKISGAVSHALGQGSSGPSGWSEAGNDIVGFGFDSDGDGDADVAAYGKLLSGIDQGRSTMPSSVQWQLKTSANSPMTQQGGNQAGGGGAGGGGVGGVSAPHTSGAPQHLDDAPTTHITNPGMKRPEEPKQPPIDREPVDDPPVEQIPVTTGTGPGDGGGTYTPPGGGSTPTLNSGGTLDSYNPTASGLGGGSGAGGTFGGGAGAGGFGSGGVGSVGGLGSGAGFAGTGDGGQLTGSGLGSNGAAGMANGAAGLGAEEGAAEAGRGGMGTMMPMRGGGAGGSGDDERERNTWLTEDDDVWGDEDAPPSVIS